MEVVFTKDVVSEDKNYAYTIEKGTIACVETHYEEDGPFGDYLVNSFEPTVYKESGEPLKKARVPASAVRKLAP